MKNRISSILAGFGYGAAAIVLIALTSCAAPESNDRLQAQKMGSWEEQRTQREQAQAAYLKDSNIKRIPTDGANRLPWYSNQLAYDWYNTSPLGFNGVPYVLLRAVIEVYPEIWKRQGSLGGLGFGPHPDDYEPATGRLRPAEQRNPLPYGLFMAQDPSVPKEDKRTDNVFFSCGACHTGRVYVKDRVRYLVGAPNTEIEAQGYAGLIYETGKKFYKVSGGQTVIDRDEVDKIVSFLKTRLDEDPAWFYGGRTPMERSDNIDRARTQVGRVLADPGYFIKELVKSSEKTKLMYVDLASKLSYIEKDGQKSPDVFGPRPGRMDAFGIVAGLVFLHVANRPEFLERLPDDHEFFEGLRGLPREEMVKQARDRLIKDAQNWMPHAPGASDIKALWWSRDSKYANWDANQRAMARVLSSGVSAVGDPYKVNVSALEAMTPFIDGLPPPPYPFAVDLSLAEKGELLFKKRCASCHSAASKHEVYKVGTDMNRATQISPTARLGLIELTRETCKLNTVQHGSDWCMPKMANLSEDNEVYFGTPRGEKSGYKATLLHGIWARAPYLHNGSVPTLWHLMRPAARPEKFIRGNIKYDEENVGFIWNKEPGLDEYGPGDTVHFAEYDTTLRGNSNKGHIFGSEWSDSEVRAVIEYMKTL